MRKDERERLVELYEGRHRDMGYDVRTLGWRNVADQVLRFKVLCDIGDLAGSSVCDVGCGFGDLQPYLTGRFGPVGYTGVDISPSLVETARQRRPDLAFHCLDILEQPFEERFDWFLLSGALNWRVEDNLALTHTMLRKMFSLADRGVAVNFLTSYVNFENPRNYHHGPEETFRFARTLTPWVSLRHDYPLWEFTLHLYKESPEGPRAPDEPAPGPAGKETDGSGR